MQLLDYYTITHLVGWLDDGLYCVLERMCKYPAIWPPSSRPGHILRGPSPGLPRDLQALHVETGKRPKVRGRWEGLDLLS